MSLTIKGLYREPKYALVVYYLSERDIFYAKDLVGFNFSKLKSIPGITDKIINRVKERFLLVKANGFAYIGNVSDKKKDSLENITNIGRIGASVVEEKDYRFADDCFSYFKTCDDLNVKISFEECFSMLPNCKWFLTYCNSHGITKLKQLNQSLFADLSEVLEPGNIEVEYVRQLFIETIFESVYPYVLNATLTLLLYDSNIQSLSTLQIDQLFLSERFEKMPYYEVFLDCCKTNGLTNVGQLMDNRLIMKPSGVGPTMMHILQETQRIVFNNTVGPKPPIIFLQNVPNENRSFPTEVLALYGVHSSVVTLLIKEGYLTIGDICLSGISESHNKMISPALKFIQFPLIIKIFQRKFAEVTDRNKMCLILKMQGATLQSIADKYNVTRERIRQIIAKCQLTLSFELKEIINLMMLDGKGWFSGKELQVMFQDLIMADCCAYALRNCEYVEYCDFADKYILPKNCPNNIEGKMKQFVYKVIGESGNFYEKLELLEAELLNCQLAFLDFKDIMNHMVRNRYHFYGDYYVKGTSSYKELCYVVILSNYPFDIKLDSDENNEDMLRLREILKNLSADILLPENNRAITSCLSDLMIISGRGRYCPIEKVIYSESIISDIYEFIQDQTQGTFYYKELFEIFKERLLAETNITNHDFLHGILKHFYPEDFNYERDLFVKHGRARVNCDERLCNFILDTGHATTKTEIMQAIPGMGEFMIPFAIERVPELILWENNAVNHVDNLSITNEDLASIRCAIEDETAKHQGYTCDKLLFEHLQRKDPAFFSKNYIRSPQNIFNIASFFFDKDYNFQRPHILTHRFPSSDTSTIGILRVLLYCNKRLCYRLNYSEYLDLAMQLGWSSGRASSVFNVFEKEFFRVSDDEYIHRKQTFFSNEFICEVQFQISKLVDSSSYFAIFSISSFDTFPYCEYKWNDFLLESIINEYKTGFKILYPQARDRRFLRGIIVRTESPDSSFEDLVVRLINMDGIVAISEIKMSKYLINKGLVIGGIPQELYACPAFNFNDEEFHVK